MYLLSQLKLLGSTEGDEHLKFLNKLNVTPCSVGMPLQSVLRKDILLTLTLVGFEVYACVCAFGGVGAYEM